jgi:hypothetical protein
MSHTPEDLEAMAQVLEDSGRYRVLRQLDTQRRRWRRAHYQS